MKKTLAIIILTAAATLTAATVTTRAAGTTYPETFYVTEIEGDTVTVRTFAGMTYQFTGAEDWQVDDVCAAVMDDNGTPRDVRDDKILQTRYTGWID